MPLVRLVNFQSQRRAKDPEETPEPVKEESEEKTRPKRVVRGFVGIEEHPYEDEDGESRSEPVRLSFVPKILQRGEQRVGLE